MNTMTQKAKTSGFGKRFWDTLIRLAENSPRIRALNALNAMSDEELAARGTTRQAEMLRIVGPY